MMAQATLPPVPFRRPEAARIVDEYIDRGERDPALIACNTAHRLLASRPCAVFPPPPTAAPPVRHAWDQILGYVDHRFRERGLSSNDPVPTRKGVCWGVISTAEGSLDLERYPWACPVVHDGGAPTPGTFWRARQMDDDASLVRGYLFAALWMAGAEGQLAFDDSKVGRRLRRECRELILAAPFNDLRVTSSSASLAGGRAPGTHGANDRGVTYVIGQSGRGLVWAPRHYDDLARLASGLPAKRGIDLVGAPVGSGRSSLFLYLPAVNLLALRGATPVVTTEGVNWEANGKNALYAPPAVDELGIDTSNVEGIR